MRVVFSLYLVFCSLMAFAQSERKFVRDGNKLYKDKKYSEAETKYLKSLEKNKDSQTAQFNLGDAYYKQQKFEDASRQFETAASNGKLNAKDQARAFHNLGNSFLKEKKYQESIAAYKNALKRNPDDNDTRYNLAYAQAMLQQQQQQQNQNKDQNKQDQQQQDQQQQQQKKEDQKNNQEKRQQSQQKQQISKEDAEKILQSLNNDEKNTQKKFVKKESTRMQVEKQW